jgi:hypothetical protein
MCSPWQPYRESLPATVARNGAIAVVLGGVFATATGGGLARWPGATLLALWPTFEGHALELFFLNWLRPRLPAGRGVQAMARVAVWFVGGVVLLFAMRATSMAIGRAPPMRWPAWWVGGLAFIGIELVAHLVLQLRGRPNFYNGRG